MLNKINLKVKNKLFFISAIHNQFAELFLFQHLIVDGILFYNLPKFKKILSKTKVNYINVTNLSINSMNKDTLFEQQFPARAREI